MDVLATRGWGIALSGAMLVAALALALTAPPVKAPPAAHGATAPAPAPAGTVIAPAAATDAMVVHFRGSGPLARAVRAQSQRRVVAELQRQQAFAGLCFVRFDRRGVALRACGAGALARWPQRLRAMGAVARVAPGE